MILSSMSRLTFKKILLSTFLTVTTLQNSHAQNIATTSSGIVVRTRGNSGGLVLRDVRKNRNTVKYDLPNGILSLDDVSIDADNERLLFALSIDSQQVCSFRLNRKNGILALRNCSSASRNFSVSPFTGISARGGSLVVSGGTGGVTMFHYNTQTGKVENRPVFRNQDLPGVIGHPDVLMVTSSLVALSTDFNDSPRFGTVIASITGSTISRTRDFRVPQSSGFANIPPGGANFPLVNSLYSPGEKSNYMYTANGQMTVQDPTEDGDETVIGGFPSGFEAVTVAVNEDKKSVFFAGYANDRSSIILKYDLGDDPLFPVFVQAFPVDAGSVASIVSSGNQIVYVTTEDASNSEIRVIELTCTDDWSFRFEGKKKRGCLK